MRCPTLEEVTQAILALLPRGRAWQTNEGVPEKGWEPAFQQNAFNNSAFQTDRRDRSILWEYWRSFAVLSHYFNQRVCDLAREFNCATIVETLDGWMTEYGLPDPCDPFPDLCTKVAALGGTRCEYYAELASRLGWTITCEERTTFCGIRMKKQTMGCGRMGGNKIGGVLYIVVHMGSSPAVSGVKFDPPLMGRLRFGRRLGCGLPSFNDLQCLLSRAIHAEILTVYEAHND